MAAFLRSISTTNFSFGEASSSLRTAARSSRCPLGYLNAISENAARESAARLPESTTRRPEPLEGSGRSSFLYRSALPKPRKRLK
jgi:hypothetical protein